MKLIALRTAPVSSVLPSPFAPNAVTSYQPSIPNGIAPFCSSAGAVWSRCRASNELKLIHSGLVIEQFLVGTGREAVRQETAGQPCEPVHARAVPDARQDLRG